MRRITEKQWRFIAAMEADPSNQTAAARKANYACPEVAGCQLMSPREYPLVAAEVERRLAAKRDDCGVSSRRIVQELAHIALLDPLDLVDADGRLKDVRDLPEGVRRAIKDVEVQERHDKDGTLVSRRVVPTELYNKPAALRQAAELLGYLRDKLPAAQNINNTVVVLTDDERRDAVRAVLGAAQRGRVSAEARRQLAELGSGDSGQPDERPGDGAGPVLGAAGGDHEPRRDGPGPVADGLSPLV